MFWRGTGGELTGDSAKSWRARATLESAMNYLSDVFVGSEVKTLKFQSNYYLLSFERSSERKMMCCGRLKCIVRLECRRLRSSRR